MLNRNGAYLGTRVLQLESPSIRHFCSLSYPQKHGPSLSYGAKAGDRRRQNELRIQRRDMSDDNGPSNSLFRAVTEATSGKMRKVMRSLTSPIVVLTTIKPGKKQQPRGMTLSSFATLSMDPEPIISFNIKSTRAEPSRTCRALLANRHFFIHLLEDGEDGARIARNFSLGDAGSQGFLCMSSTTTSKWLTADDEEISDDGMKTLAASPLLGGKGIKEVLRCQILDDGVGLRGVNGEGQGIVTVGDHLLLVARVNAILKYDADAVGYGLSYADGAYRRVGNEIEINRSELEDSTGKVVGSEFIRRVYE